MSEIFTIADVGTAVVMLSNAVGVSAVVWDMVVVAVQSAFEVVLSIGTEIRAFVAVLSVGPVVSAVIVSEAVLSEQIEETVDITSVIVLSLGLDVSVVITFVVEL